ncbi:hypothetical protein BH23THE1_BH23THE1_23450 [soil metagenome]
MQIENHLLMYEFMLISIDILRLFDERNETMKMVYENILKDDSIKVHHNDLKVLVGDQAFVKELNNIKNNLERNFKEFSKYN